MIEPAPWLEGLRLLLDIAVLDHGTNVIKKPSLSQGLKKTVLSLNYIRNLYFASYRALSHSLIANGMQRDSSGFWITYDLAFALVSEEAAR